MRKRIDVAPYLLLAPGMALLLLFKVYPIFSSIVGSLFTSDRSGGAIFAGVSNYASLFANEDFFASLLTTIKFNLVLTTIQIGLALVLAFILHSRLRGKNMFRSIFYISLGFSLATATVIWSSLLDPNVGVINSVFQAFHLPRQPFLTSRTQALGSIIVICTYKGFSYWMIILLAGINGISTSVLEAARIDGANYPNLLMKVMLPLLKRPLAFCIVSDALINMMVFTPIYVATQGGPSRSTSALMYRAYVSMYQFIDRGQAYAMIVVLLALSVLVAGVVFRVLRPKD